MPDDRALREPPHSIEAEQAVLGGIFLAEDWLDHIGEIVSESDFYSAADRLIFRHAKALAANGKPVDIVTLHEATVAAGDAEKIGLEYLGQLVANVPSAANIEHYARIVRDRSIKREILALGSQVTAMAYSAQPATDIVDAIQRKAQALGEHATNSGGMTRLGDALPNIVEKIESLHSAQASSPRRCITTGIPELDAHIPGDADGKLYSIASRPAMGKSSLALQIGVINAKAGKAVAMFSLEMTLGELAQRALAFAGSVDVEALATGRLDSQGWDRINDGMGQLHGLPLFIDDQPRLTVDRIRTRARRLQRKAGLDLIIVDYLQLLDGQGASRYEQVSEISRGLKLLANELHVPVIALSQVNRRCEDRTDKRPQLSDLRDSGSVEQDADVVMFIYRHEEYYPEDADSKGRAEISIAKNRSGRTGRVYCTFVGEHSRFAPTSWRPVPPTRTSVRRGMED